MRNSGRRDRAAHIRGDSTGTAGMEVDSFVRIWARGGKATAPTGRSGATNGKAVDGTPINAYMKWGVMEEVLDLAGGTSATSVNNLLPANSEIGTIVTHAVTDWGTPVSYNIGDTTTATRFGTGLTNDNISEGPAYARAHLSGTVAFTQASAAKVKIIANAAGTGKLHVAVFYRQFVGGQA